MMSIIFSLILFGVTFASGMEIEQVSLDDGIYHEMLAIQNEIHSNMNYFLKYKNSVGIATPLQPHTLHQKDTITENKTFEFFKKKSRDVFKAFAHTMARRDNEQENAYTLLSKRIVANYLHDTGIQEVQESYTYVNNKDKNSEYVELAQEGFSEIELGDKETDSDILLNKFVQKYHTSVTCIADTYPELISANKYTFALSKVGIRSLKGLEELVSSQYVSTLGEQRVPVNTVILQNNYLKKLSIQKLRDVFPHVHTINCDGNPLVDVDFAGAQLGNNFYIRSTCPEKMLLLDIESLRDIEPINIFVCKQSLASLHKQNIAHLVAQMDTQGRVKRYALRAGIGMLAASAGAAFGLGSVYLSAAWQASVAASVYHNYTYAKIYDTYIHDANFVLTRELVSTGLALLMTGIYGLVESAQGDRVFGDCVSRYKPHNIVFN